MAEKVNNKPKGYDVSVICTIARMNPPTPGHMFLIRRLIHHAVELNEDKVYIFLSSRNDDNENPLECTYKQSILGNDEDMESSTHTMINSEKQKMIDETQNQGLKQKIRRILVITSCSSNPVMTLSSMLTNPEYEGKRINLIIVAGSDRVASYKSFINSSISKGKVTNVSQVDPLQRKNTNKVKGLNKNTLSRKNMSEIPIDAYSASFVRKVVSYGLEDKFYDIYQHYLPRKTISELYERISSSLGYLPSPGNKGSKKRKTNQGAASSSAASSSVSSSSAASLLTNRRRSNRSTSKGNAGKRAKRGNSKSNNE